MDDDEGRLAVPGVQNQRRCLMGCGDAIVGFVFGTGAGLVMSFLLWWGVCRVNRMMRKPDRHLDQPVRDGNLFGGCL